MESARVERRRRVVPGLKQFRLALFGYPAPFGETAVKCLRSEPRLNKLPWLEVECAGESLDVR